MMTSKNQQTSAHFKDVLPESANAPILPAQILTILRSAGEPGKISHEEARILLRQVNDVVLEETGLTRQQLEYELYLRSMGDD
jgi:hypothetical protein